MSRRTTSLLGAVAVLFATWVVLSTRPRPREEALSRGPVQKAESPTTDGLVTTGSDHPGPTKTTTTERRTSALPSHAVTADSDEIVARGIVHDEDDLGLSGIAVVARSPDGTRTHSVTTDTTGRFCFSELEQGQWFFAAESEEYARSWWREVLSRVPMGSELELRLYRSRTVHGLVIDESSTPVPGASVVLARERLPGAGRPAQGHLTHVLQRVVTDGQGRFELVRLRPGLMTVVLHHADHARTITQFDVANPDVRLVIESGRALRGRVLLQGSPLADVTVVGGTPSRAALQLGAWRVTTDDDGAFTIPNVPRFPNVVGFPQVAVWLDTVSIDGEDWGSCEHHIYAYPRSQMLPPVTIEALPADEVGDPRCRIDVGRDLRAEAEANGKPFGTAELVVSVAPNLLPATRTVWVGVQVVGFSQDYLRESVAPGANAVFENLAAGEYRVWARGRGGPSILPQTIELAEGETRHVQLDAGEAVLSGRVLAGGEPVGEGSISFRALESAHPILVRSGGGELHPDGAYTITGIPLGIYELTYRRPTGIRVLERVAVDDSDVHFDLHLPGGRIEGTVFGSRAEQVHVYPRGLNGSAGNTGCTVAPDTEGVFAVEDLAEGTYNVWARTEVLLLASVTLGPGHMREHVVLRPPERTGYVSGRIEGLPEDPESFGLGLCPRDDQGYDTSVTYGVSVNVGAGTFRSGPVPEGTYALKGGSWRGEVPLLWQPDVVVVRDRETRVELTVPSARKVRLVLDSGDSTPSRKVWRLQLPAGDWIPYGALIGSGPTGDRAGSGPVLLPVGDYVLEADFGDPRPVRRPFRVDPGDEELVVVASRK